jgi:hypothetical protein
MVLCTTSYMCMCYIQNLWLCYVFHSVTSTEVQTASASRIGLKNKFTLHAIITLSRLLQNLHDTN